MQGSRSAKRMNALSTRIAVGVVATCLFIVGVGAASAQGDGHAGHHPSPSDAPLNSTKADSVVGSPMPSAGPSTREGGNGDKTMNGGMGEMMGRPPAKEFYPALLDLPELSAPQRDELEARARSWISNGLDGVARAENALRHSNAGGDVAGSEQAVTNLRDSLSQVRSGVIVLRSLTQGQSPKEIATNWFRTELGLQSRQAVSPSESALGLSWFHIATMVLVGALAAAMAAMQFARMRRANALAARLMSAPTQQAEVVLGAVQQAPTAPSSPPQDAVTDSHETATPPPEKQRQTLWKGQLQVAAIYDETPNVKTFRLKNPDGGPMPFAFAPGQFLTYSADIDGKHVKRSYTIASSAAQTAYLETTIKREDVGVFSRFMHDHVRAGDVLDVLGPSGVFTFNGTEADSVVLIGGGVGITPLMSVIRYLADTSWPGDIYLVYGARSTEDFIFRSELEFLQRRMPNLHVAATMARAAGDAWMGTEGPITRDLLLRAVPDLAKRRVHLCGPPTMMGAVKKLLFDLGVPVDNVKTEAFGPALGAVPPPGVTVTEPASKPNSNVTGQQVIGPATATIRFAKSNKMSPLAPDISVLEAAEAAGVAIDYSCRAGICGVCKTKLLEGSVTMEVEDALTADDKSRNLILACQAKSIGNLTVEA